MALLDDVKLHLRIASTAYNTEVSDLIATAKKDLEISGIPTFHIDETDPLIKRAITLYCKANFGYGNPDSEKFKESYNLLKAHLCMSGDYALE